MSLLKPKKVMKNVTQKITLTDALLEEVLAYCKWAGLVSENDFFVDAAEFVLHSDKAWLKHKKRPPICETSSSD